MEEGLRVEKTKASADYLAKINADSKFSNALSLDDRIDLQMSGVHTDVWNFLVGARNSDTTTFFASAKQFDDIRTLIKSDCGKGLCVPLQNQTRDGMKVYRFTHEDVRYRVAICTDLKNGCREVGEVKSIFPECGPGIFKFATKDFLSRIKKAQTTGEPNVYVEAANAYVPKPCGKGK